MARHSHNRTGPKWHFGDMVNRFLGGANNTTGPSSAGAPVNGNSSFDNGSRAPIGASAHRSPHVDTDAHRPAPTCTDAGPMRAGAHQAPTPTAGQDQDLFMVSGVVEMVGAIRSPKEHAVALLEELRDALWENDLEGKAIYQGAIHEAYLLMCKERDWCPRGWNSVARELKKLPGVRKGKVWGSQRQRLTFYEIEPDPATTYYVTEQAAAPVTSEHAGSPATPKLRVA